MLLPSITPTPSPAIREGMVEIFGFDPLPERVQAGTVRVVNYLNDGFVDWMILSSQLRILLLAC